MALPATGFEQTGEWTTLADETAFLQQIAQETDVTLSEAGRTVQDQLIHRVDLGSNPDNTMLITCLVHANEQASREAALQQIRDLAYATDPAIVDYLANHRIVWITNINADRFPYARNNAANVNINRDHYKLTQPESQAIATVIRDTNPHLMVDAHEYFSAGSLDNWLGRGGGLPGSHPQLQATADAMFDDISGQLDAQGYHTDAYFYRLTSTSFLSLVAGAHHAVGFLSETNAVNDTPTQRVAIQYSVLGMVRDWHEHNAAQCSAAQRASKQWAVTSRGPDILSIREEYLGDDYEETAQLAGYQITGELPEKYQDIFGITIDADGFAPMQQEARLFLPQLLDPEAMDVATEAHRVYNIALPRTPLAGLRVRVQGVTLPVKRIVRRIRDRDRGVFPSVPRDLSGY